VDLFPCGIATMTLDVQCGQRLSWELTMTTTQQSATQEEWGRRRDIAVAKTREVRPAKYGEFSRSRTRRRRGGERVVKIGGPLKLRDTDSYVDPKNTHGSPLLPCFLSFLPPNHGSCRSSSPNGPHDARSMPKFFTGSIH